MRLQEVEELRRSLAAETAAFNAQRQAWRAFMRSCEHHQQGTVLHGGKLQPDYTLVPVSGGDTYQVAVSSSLTCVHVKRMALRMLSVCCSESRLILI